jgi:hypothetical protein
MILTCASKYGIIPSEFSEAYFKEAWEKKINNKTKKKPGRTGDYA